MIKTITMSDPYIGSINVFNFEIDSLLIKPHKNDHVYYFSDMMTVKKLDGSIFLPDILIFSELDRYVTEDDLDDSLTEEISIKLFKEVDKLVEKLTKVSCIYVYETISMQPTILSGNHIPATSLYPVACMKIGLFGSKTPHIIKGVRPTKYKKIEIFGVKG